MKWEVIDTTTAIRIGGKNPPPFWLYIISGMLLTIEIIYALNNQ